MTAPAAPVAPEVTLINPDKFKTLLAQKLEYTRKGAEGDQRNMWPNSEVQDLLLDLWTALNLDIAATVEEELEPALA